MNTFLTTHPQMMLATLLAIISIASAQTLQTNAANKQLYPGGVYETRSFNAASLPCTGTCNPATTYVFDGGHILLSGGATFETAPSTAVTSGGRGIIFPTGSSFKFVFDEPQKAIGMSMNTQQTDIIITASTTPTNGIDRAATRQSEKIFFSVPAPYDQSYAEWNVQAKPLNPNTVTFKFSSFIFGETGFNCIGGENEDNEVRFPCALCVNLINIPADTTDITIYQNAQQQAANNALYTLESVGDRIVTMCVPENPAAPFQAVINENNNLAVYRTGDATTNYPDCTLEEHKCFLDPRATMQVPIGCLPQPDVISYAGGSSVRLNLYDNGDSAPFRTIPDVTINPVVYILAVPEAYPSLIINGNQNKDVRTQFDYDCSKGTTGAGPNELGQCKYEDPVRTQFSQFPKLTGELVIRAKCSAQRQPPMPTGVILTVKPTAADVTYVVPERGNEDTRLCVLTFGTYNIEAAEGPVVSQSQAICSNTASSFRCNGTPIEVVSAIYTEGCSQPAPICGVAQPTNPSAGGDANGNFPVQLSQIGVGVFRTEEASPYVPYSTCVLNVPEIKVEMDVIPSSATVEGLYDCSVSEETLIHPTENSCKRIVPDGVTPTTLTLFRTLCVDLTGLEAGSIDYDVRAVFSANGLDFTNAVLPPFPTAGEFCGRGGSQDCFCVPAVGKPAETLPCGNTYLPEAIQVFAEECGETGNASVACPGNKKRTEVATAQQHNKRDDGTCIRVSEVTDCSEGGACAVAVTQKLCIWDLLYLDRPYSGTDRGVVVETLSNSGTVTRSWDNQGGSPRTYTVLAGFLQVRISEQYGAGDTPSITSGALQCKDAASCSFNDFLSMIDLTGLSNVRDISDCNDDTVSCSAISYADNYSNGGAKTVLNSVVATLTFGANSEPLYVANLGSDACTSTNCIRKKHVNAIVIKTGSSAALYGATYNWGSYNKAVSGIACTGKSCDAIPCLVRWAAVDPHCPDLRRQIAFTPEGVVPDTESDPHRDLYKYSSVVDASPTASVGNIGLCSEEIDIDNTRCSACRQAQLSTEYAPQGFENNTFMLRYFLLNKDGADNYPFTVQAGCASAQFDLQCPMNVADTGRKKFTNGDGCTSDVQTYWHACSFVGLPDNLKGPNQYWRNTLFQTLRELPEPVDTSETCLAANAIDSADPWQPLSPYTIVSVDLTDLPNGVVPLVDQANITDTPPNVPGSQAGFRGVSYVNEGQIGQNANFLNPFELSVCCDSCNSAVRTLRQQKMARDDVSCGFSEPSACRPAPDSPRFEAGGYDHLICVLAGAQYSFKVSERYRNERHDNFLPLEPKVCPEARNQYEWTQAIRNCRPNVCIEETTSVPVRYPGTLFYNTVDKLFDDIKWNETYSTNFRCNGALSYAHTLLRPNRLARPAEANIPYLKDNTYEWRVNSMFVSSHSDPFFCTDNAQNPGKCTAPEQDLRSSLAPLRSEPQE